MPVVAILLATRNGEPFLREQLTSYERQTMKNWELHVSDDGSSDQTISIIQDFARNQSRKVSLREGPRRGFFRNFMSLALDESIVADFFAFSDQDDVWKEEKLDRALKCLLPISSEVPAVYFSRTELVDEGGRHLGHSPLFARDPSFQNALVQNIGGGNTMVFNFAARRLLFDWGSVEAVSHDWWLYQLVTAVGGAAYYDPVASIQYRLHGHNLVGSNVGWKARLTRLLGVMRGRFSMWNEVNSKALAGREMKLSPDNRKTLWHFRKAREAMWPLRPYHLYKSGAYRQSIVDNVGMYIAALLGRI
jgi:glycosyltransferase involved in cell wall biosynthesis